LMKKLQAIVGLSNNVIDGHVENSSATAAYLKGQRLGHGSAVAIVCPTTLSQLPPIVQACLEAQCTIIVQGANTGLTGSSVPNTTTNSGRPTVVISMKHLTTIVPVDDGMKMLCHAGVGLGSLQQYVEDTVPGRMSHSVLGSTFLNPTTAAGVAFGSGGTQIRKGPSTTERALYLKVADNGHGQPIVKIVNTLGIQSQELENNDDFGPEGEFEYQGTKQFGDGGTVIDQLDAMSRGTITTHIKSNHTYGTHPTYDHEYSQSLCTFDEEVTRYNADTKGLDCNRSEGKVLMLATVHDTFPKPTSSKSYWFSFAELETAIQFKEQVALTEPEHGHGIEYVAPLATKLRWMKMDPFNVMNPGVGGLSTQYKYGRDGESLWKEEEPHTGTRGTRKDRT